jgi:hypothetical protein
VVSKLVTQSLLDLTGKQDTVMAEVTLQRVTVDDDPVLIAFARDTVSEVLPICMYLVSEIGYHDRDVRQYLLEFSRQPIDSVDDQGLELVELRSLRHASTIESRVPLPWGGKDSNLRPTDYESAALTN